MGLKSHPPIHQIDLLPNTVMLIDQNTFRFDNFPQYFAMKENVKEAKTIGIRFVGMWFSVDVEPKDVNSIQTLINI